MCTLKRITLYLLLHNWPLKNFKISKSWAFSVFFFRFSLKKKIYDGVMNSMLPVVKFWFFSSFKLFSHTSLLAGNTICADLSRSRTGDWRRLFIPTSIKHLIHDFHHRVKGGREGGFPPPPLVKLVFFTVKCMIYIYDNLLCLTLNFNRYIVHSCFSLFPRCLLSFANPPGAY